MNNNVKLWTEEENKILIEYYPAEGINVSLRLPGRSIAAIKNHAQQLNVFNRKQMTGWSADELEILKKYYPIEGKKVLTRLPGRSLKTIQVTANRMGIKKIPLNRPLRKADPEVAYIVENKESGAK